MTKRTTPKKLTMLDLMTKPSGPAEYHIIQGGNLEYAGTDWAKAGKMMSWLRKYRWAEVNFFKDGNLKETLPEPVYKEPPPPDDTDEIQVTAAMVRALNEVINDPKRRGPYLQVLKEALRAALRAYYDNKGNGS